MSLSPSSASTHPASPDQLNAECIKALQSYKVGDGGYVAVVGAGPSSPIIPRGDDLIAEMKKACGINCENGIPFWDFYEAAKNGNSVEYSRILKSKFDGAPYWSSDVYEMICQISFKSIITTNYDQYLPKAFGKVEGSGWNDRFCVYPPRSNPDANGAGMATAIDFDYKKYLVAIHGYRDTAHENWPLDSIILTKSDYMLHYFAASKSQFLYGWWKQVLSSHNCIFIGTSLQEPGIGKALLDLGTSGAFARQPRRHLQLINASLSEIEISGIKQPPSYPKAEILHGAVQQVQFDPKTSFVGLLDVLSEIAGISICTDFEPRMAAPTFPDFDNPNSFHDSP
jgi:hypothetical protein